MARIVHTRLWVVLDTLLGRYHPSTSGIDVSNKALMERETDLEEYSPWDWVLKLKIPALVI